MANQSNLIVRESITEALVQLMERKPFSQITVTELARRAGVGRVSFYRNYDSMEDVLVRYLNEQADEVWVNMENAGFTEIWERIFILFDRVKWVALPMHRAGLDPLFFSFVESKTGADEGLGLEESYHRAMFSGLLSGLLCYWLKRGCRDSKEELRQIMENASFINRNAFHIGG